MSAEKSSFFLTKAAPHPLVVRQRVLGGGALGAHDLHVGGLLEGELDRTIRREGTHEKKTEKKRKHGRRRRNVGIACQSKAHDETMLISTRTGWSMEQHSTLVPFRK